MPMEARMSRKRTGYTRQTKTSDPGGNEQWAIDSTYVQDWIDSLDNRTLEQLQKPFELLQERGPTLGAPYAKPIVLKTGKSDLLELRAKIGKEVALRVLYTWENGVALLLYGGDKAGKWKRWYPSAIRIATERKQEYEINREKERLREMEAYKHDL